MKKVFTLISLVVLTLTAVLLLSSCDPITPEGLYEKIDKTMSEVSSYEVDGEMTMVFYVSEKKLSITSAIKEIVSNDVDGDFYFFTENNTHVYSKELGISKRTTTRDAYYDGYGFLRNDEVRFCAPMTPEEFMKYYEGKAEGFDENMLSACKEKTMEHNSDGSWTATFSQFAKEDMDTYVEGMGLEGNIYGVTIKDMAITLIADEYFRMSEMKISFDIDGGKVLDNAPVIEVVMTYSAYNDATPKTDNLVLNNYTQIADLYFFDQLDEMNKALKEKEEGYFTVDTKRNLDKPNYDGYFPSTFATVEYGTKDDDFYFNIRTNSAGGSLMTTEYANGVMIVESEGETTTRGMSESQAESYIEELIGMAYYDPNMIEAIDLVADGSYAVRYKKNMTTVYGVTAGQLGVSNLGTNQLTVYYTVENDEIQKVRAVYKQQCTYNGDYIDYVLDSTIDFTAQK